MKKKLTKPLLIGLFLVFLMKLGVGLTQYNGLTFEGDEVDYYHDAKIMASGDVFMLNPVDEKMFVGPGYPWLVAIVLFLNFLPLIVLMNATFSTLTVWIVYSLSRRFMSRDWARIAALWAALYVPFYLYLGDILKESFLQFIVPFTIWITVHAKFKKRFIWYLLSAFSVFYMVLTDERYFMFVPFYLIILVLGDWKKQLNGAIYFSMSFIMLISVWTIRNYLVFDRFILITERFHSPIDKFLGHENDLIKSNQLMFDDLQNMKREILAGNDSLVYSHRHENIKEAIEDGHIPRDYSLAERFWYNSLGYWSPVRTKGILLGKGWKYRRPRSVLVNFLYTLNYGLLLPFFIFSIFVSVRRKNWLLNVIILYVLFHYLLHAAMIIGMGRYRHPIDPLIILAAIYGMSVIWPSPGINKLNVLFAKKRIG